MTKVATVAVVLAAKVDSPEAHRAMSAAVDGLSAAGVDELAVAWDDGDDDAPFPRARRVNEAVVGLSSDWVAVVDPRVVFPYAAAFDELRRRPEAAVQLVARLRPRGRDGIEGEASDLAQGKGAWAVRRDWLLAAGGLSEAFEGAWDEGLELFRRLRRFTSDLATLGHEGTSPWAPRSEADVRGRDASKARWAEAQRELDRDPAAYVAALRTTLPPDVDALARLARRQGRDAAVRTTAHRPPPERPARLPGELWGVTCLFNPEGFAAKVEGFRVFRDGLRSRGVPLVAVELAFGDAPFSLGDADADVVVRLRGRSVLWQKERLLNLALAHLPASCDKVAWLDADVLFERDDWADATARALTRWPVVQPFSLSTRLLPGERRVDLDGLPAGSGEREVLHGMAFGVEAKGLGCLDRYLVHGHSGYAWAARRGLLERHGLYDRNVIGNGDLNIAHAFFGGAAAVRAARFSPRALAHLSRWADAVHADVGGAVGWVEGTVFHLFHGWKDDRRYVDRLDLLRVHDFDPEVDVTAEDGEPLAWSSDKPALHEAVRAYFAQRREG